MKRLWNVLIALGVGLTAVMLVAEPASADALSDEAGFVGKLNELRTSKGLAPVSVRDDLTTLARSWAGQMTAAGAISHNPALTTQAPADWTRVGENVGLGGDVQSLHDAFVASPAHYANMVGDYQFVGVGVVWSGSTMFVAVEFMTGGHAVAQSVTTAGTKCTKNRRGKTVCRKVRKGKAKVRRAARRR
jgi:uncharacterized protein YkwD